MSEQKLEQERRRRQWLQCRWWKKAAGAVRSLGSGHGFRSHSLQWSSKQRPGLRGSSGPTRDPEQLPATPTGATAVACQEAARSCEPLECVSSLMELAGFSFLSFFLSFFFLKEREKRKGRGVEDAQPNLQASQARVSHIPEGALQPMQSAR